MAMLCCLNPRASILSSHLLAGSEMLELAGAGPLTVAHTDTLGANYIMKIIGEHQQGKNRFTTKWK